MPRRFGNCHAVSKTVVIVIVVVLVAAFGATAAYVYSAQQAPGLGSNISCSSSSNSSSVQVAISSGASNSANAPGYAPDKITLVIGENASVTWTNDDSVHHTVTSASAPSGASFNSGDMAPGGTYTCSFSEAGTYQYYCKYHSWMTGTITVEEGS
jgi:plastocyanin